MAYRLGNVEKNLPLSSTSVFDLASVSKQFTAVAILKLQTNNKIQVAAPVRHYLPDFAVETRAREITVIDLLRHVSGLADYTGSGFKKSDAYLTD